MTELRVKVADAAVAQGDTVLSTIGLGSCVAIALHDPRLRVGGLAHILLPSEMLAQDRSNRAKFAGTAVPLLIERMKELGARGGSLCAKIAGGASMFTSLLPAGGLQIGERNLIATRAALAGARIPILGEDVGGSHGRSVYFHVSTGEVVVKSVVKGNVVL